MAERSVGAEMETIDKTQKNRLTVYFNWNWNLEISVFLIPAIYGQTEDK